MHTSLQAATDLAVDVPHFVGVGAPRCGTTWTFKMLQLHPEVWIPWKEIHYFDSVDPHTDSGYHIQSRWLRLKVGWPYLLRRLALRSVPGAAQVARAHFPLKAVHAPGFRWTARYLFGDVSLQWYADLFREGARAGLRCGEITPAYFMLSETAIADFARALPRARAFVMLRNPLEWAWSGLCKAARDHGRNPATLSEMELIPYCPVPTGRGRVDFGSNLDRWLRNFPRERLLVAFHEEVEATPSALLDRLCEFIGIGPLRGEARKLLKERVLSSARGSTAPPAVARYIAERFAKETELVASLVGGPALQWLAGIDAMLNRSSGGAHGPPSPPGLGGGAGPEQKMPADGEQILI